MRYLLIGFLLGAAAWTVQRFVPEAPVGAPASFQTNGAIVTRTTPEGGMIFVCLTQPGKPPCREVDR